MKYAILSDIHANEAAFRTVLEDASRHGVGKVICLGDVVGYGPEAESTVVSVRDKVDVCLMGNHDAAVSAVITGSGFSLAAVRGVMRHRGETSIAARQWLSSLPYVYEEGDIACAHGDFTKPSAFRYVTTPELAGESLKVRSERILFVGHTHVPAVFEWRDPESVRQLPQEDVVELKDGSRYLVNVGSVGYPRHEVDSTYCIYDSDERIVYYRRVQFDYSGYELAMRARNVALPSWFEDMKKRKVLNGWSWIRAALSKFS